MPFWKGDGVGRPYELGRAVGEAARTRRFGDLDELAATNLANYLDDQEAATGVIPSDRTIVVERFRDEIGDWRVCVLSPFGGRVHAPWALAVERRMGETLGIEVESLWADDGESTQTRQSPISSRKRSTTMVRSDGMTPVAASWSSR